MSSSRELRGRRPAARAIQVGIELRRCLALVAGHQVAVEVERDLDLFDALRDAGHDPDLA